MKKILQSLVGAFFLGLLICAGMIYFTGSSDFSKRYIKFRGVQPISGTIIDLEIENHDEYFWVTVQKEGDLYTFPVSQELFEKLEVGETYGR